MVQNNKLMKKTDSIDEASGLVVKGQRDRSQSRGPKKNPSASSSMLTTTGENQGTLRKNILSTRRC